MPSPHVAIVGYGRFGRALADLVTDAGFGLAIFDRDRDAGESVLRPDAVVRAPSAADAVRGADIVVLAVPVPALREALVEIAPHLTAEQLVVDVGSVKLGPVAAMTDVLGGAVPWAATHPLFGPTSLALGERPLHVVVCPNPLHPGAAGRARAFYERLGCRVVEADADTHDRVMAETHALTFFLAKGMLAVGAGEGAPFAPPSFQAIARTIDTVRDAGHLFAAIHRDNPHAAAARRRLLTALAAVDAALGAPADAPADEALAQPAVAAGAIPDLGDRAPALRETRELIDQIDGAIVDLLARRAHLARRAGRVKTQLGRAITDPVREAELIAARRAVATESGLDADAVEAVFRAIVELSRSVQRG